MSSMLDMILSTIIFGIATILLLTLRGTMGDARDARTLELSSLRSADDLSLILETDFYRMGYRVQNEVITLADSDMIVFKIGRDENNGNPDSIRYVLGALNESSSAFSRPLYRQLNTDTPRNVANGLQAFSIVYLDSVGNTIAYDSLTTPLGRAQIRSFNLRFKTQQPRSGADSAYTPVYVQKRVTPRNLRNF